jgi:hypothetical protein
MTDYDMAMEYWEHEPYQQRWRNKAHGYIIHIDHEVGNNFIYLTVDDKRYIIAYGALYAHVTSRVYTLMLMLSTKKAVDKLISKDRGKYGYVEYLESQSPITFT